MGFSFGIENLEQPYESYIEIKGFKPETVKADPTMLKKYAELAVLLDTEETAYDAKTGLKIPGAFTPEMAEKRLGGYSSIYFAYDKDGKIVGMLTTKRCEYENAFFVSSLVVDKSARGKGIGSALLMEVIYKHKGEKALLRVSDNNQEAKALYKKLGFKMVSHVMYREPNKI